MGTQAAGQRTPADVIRLIARVWSVTSIALFILFVVGEGDNPTSTTEWMGFLFFPVGICVGLIIAWWKEGVGGGITVASLLVFYAFQLIVSGSFPKGWAWLAFAAPGFLFLLCWWWKKSDEVLSR